MTEQTETYTTDGTFDVPSGAAYLIVRVYGAGGQGGEEGGPDGDYAGSTGGDGGGIEVELDPDAYSSIDVSVGEHGTNGGTGYTNGGAGGETSNEAGNGGHGGGETAIVGASKIAWAGGGGGGGGSGGYKDYSGISGTGGAGGGGGAPGGTGGEPGADEDGGTSQPAGNDARGSVTVGGNGGHGGDWDGFSGDDGSNGSEGYDSGAILEQLSTLQGTSGTSYTGTGNDGYVEFVYGIPPETPSNVSTTVNGDDITITWDAVSDADEIRIYRDTASGVTTGQTPHATVSGTATSYTDSGLLDGEQYFYVLTSYNGTESDPSSEVSGTTVLPAPTNLSADAVRAAEIDLSWSATHDNGETRVEYKLSDAGSWTTFSTVSPGTTAETITGLLNGEQYDARVVAQTEHSEAVDQ